MGVPPALPKNRLLYPRPRGDMRHFGRLFQPCAGFRPLPHPYARLPCDGVPLGYHAGAAPPSFMIILGGSHSRRDTLRGARGVVDPPLGRMRPPVGRPDVAGPPVCKNYLRLVLAVLFNAYYNYLRLVGRVPHDIANRERAESPSRERRTTHAVGHWESLQPVRTECVRYVCGSSRLQAFLMPLPTQCALSAWALGSLSSLACHLATTRLPFGT